MTEKDPEEKAPEKVEAPVKPAVEPKKGKVPPIAETDKTFPPIQIRQHVLKQVGTKDLLDWANGLGLPAPVDNREGAIATILSHEYGAKAFAEFQKA